MSTLSRRQFTTLIAAQAAVAQGSPLTARGVVERIQEKIGVPWNAKSYRDTFKCGNPDTPVKGISSTFMATLDVIQRSHAAGLNFVITHEPTFWSDADTTATLTDDPLYKFKVDFIEKNNMIVWRMHDHLHAKKPDKIFVGWNKALGWERYQTHENSQLYVLPATTMDAIAKHLAANLKSRSVRLVGDPQLKVTKVALGSHSLDQNISRLREADVIVVFEARERETPEYVRDTVASGEKKGLILIAHEAGEEAGMDEFASWLKTIVTEVPIRFLPANDNFWLA
jgi:putative NIF3 family GTP cyclohydrolase 1 type 2